MWTLLSRPEGSFVNALERDSVDGYRAVASRLADERRRVGLTLRQLSVETGIALSVLTGVEQGSAWPRFDTLATQAAGLGLRVQVAGERVQTSGEDRVDPQVLMRSWVDAGYPVSSPWRVLVSDELRHRMLAAGLSKTGAAREVGLRHNTVTDMYRLGSSFPDVSVRTLSAIAAFLGTCLEVVPDGDPWL